MTRAYGSPKAFLIAMGILMALAVVAAAVAWWFLEKVKKEIESGGPGVPGAVLGSSRSGPEPRAVPPFVVTIQRDGLEPAEVRLGEQVLGPVDDPSTLAALERHAREAIGRAGPDAPNVVAEVHDDGPGPSPEAMKTWPALTRAGFKVVRNVERPSPAPK